MKAVCRYCHQRIVFARTARGKSMPVDPDVNPNGNLACYRDVSGTLVAHVITEAEPARPFERVFMPHFATCPKLPKPPKPPVRVTAPVGADLAKVIPISRAVVVDTEGA